MSRTRLLIAAAQGTVVATALVVVFLTLLTPDDETPLSGIDAPGGGPTTQPLPHEPGDRDGPGGDDGPSEPGEQGPGPDAPGQRPDGLAFTGPPAAAPPSPAPAPGAAPQAPISPPSEDGESPTDEQYEDTMDRLIADLGLGR